MGSVKKHITYSHDLNGFPCHRCWEQFKSTKDLHRHQRSPEPCPLSDPPPNLAHPRGGISISTRDLLGSRKDHEKVNSWERLWAVLFGDEEPVKDHNFVPVVELEEVLVEFYAERPSFIRALDAQLKDLLGDMVYDRFRAKVDAIKTFVQQWMEELLLEKCRKIPTNGGVCGIASTPAQLEVVGGTGFNSPFSGSESYLQNADDNYSFLTEWDWTVDSRFPDQSASSADGMATQEQHHQGSHNIMTTGHESQFHRPGGQGLVQQASNDQMPYQAPAYGVSIAYEGSSGTQPVPLPTPIPTPPNLAVPAPVVMSGPQPLFSDPIACRAVQMADSQQMARRWYDQQPQQYQQSQGLQQPRIPGPIQRFHERHSGTVSRPKPTAHANNALRDSGISDVGSLYSANGQGGVWAMNQRAPSPASRLNNFSYPEGYQGYSSTGGTFLNTDDDE
ncbi:hypothetical protein B0T14DRAFT_525990 [Immersiella caudata]|uniref:C2H2-type domain-containing protein n=1 Tax=Immersiella caudata TaxID=314043 RepID=A0AA39WDC3_9PEZI|nr:hypothetical protein B0T14DRAFT_525990 [Immersiella caudata]